MKKRITILLGIILVFSGCANDKKRYEPPKESFDRSAVVATQGDLTLDIGDVINGFSQYGRYETLAQRAITQNETSYVTQVINGMVEAQREADLGRALGYENDPQYKNFIKRLDFEKRMQMFVGQEVLTQVSVRDKEVHDYYERNKDALFTTPRRIKFKWIFVKEEKWGSWENAKSRAELIQQKLQGKSSFQDLLYSYSDSEEKDRLKDKGWFTREDLELNPALQEAAFSLREIGEWIGPVRSGNGYHFGMLTGEKPEIVTSFDDVKKKIGRTLFAETIGKHVDELVKKEERRLKIERHPEVLNNLNASDEECLFSVDGFDYTLGMFRQLLKERDVETTEGTDKELERQIRDAVLYNTALKKGYGDVDIEKVHRGVINDYLRNLYLEREVKSKIEVPESRILEEYTKNKDIYIYPPSVHPYWIFVAARVSPNARIVEKELAMIEAEKKAQKIFYNLILETGEPFRNLALQFSDDLATKSSGGDLGIYKGGPKGHIFDQAAFSLEEGEISQPLRLSNGYAIVWVEEKIPRRQMTYEEAKGEIRDQFIDEEFSDAKNELAKKYQADVVADQPNLEVVSDYLLKAAEDNLLRAYMVH